jgi:hypothetical protein
MRRKQRQLERKRAKEAELEAKKEAQRVAKLEAEARKQEEIVVRRKRLLEQQQHERFRQKHIQRKEKLTEQKWDNQLDTLLAQIKDRFEKDNKLEEIRIIIQNREPSLQELDWDNWLSNPLNQKLADLDFDYAAEMFKRDNLMAKRLKPHRRGGTGGRPRRSASKYALAFTGNGASGAEDYVTTDFNPDDYSLNLGFTVSYWVRPDEVGSTMFAFGRRHSTSQRFTFGINRPNAIFIGIGGNRKRSTWASMGVDPSLLDGSDIKIDGTWYHFAVTYADRESTSEGGVSRKIYLNGELLADGNINWDNTGGGTGGMMFGGRNLAGTGYDNGWACALDQVAIFDTAKDAAWVASVYNTDKKKLDLSNESGLVGYWKFDEGSGTTVKDYSGNGNHGTFASISGDTTAYPTWEHLGNVITR